MGQASPITRAENTTFRPVLHNTNQSGPATYKVGEKFVFVYNLRRNCKNFPLHLLNDILKNI